MNFNWLYSNESRHYRLRMLGGIILVELLMIAIITIWPANEEAGDVAAIAYKQEQIYIEEVNITQQSSIPPPPPKPMIPVPVPDDQIVDEQIELEDPDMSELYSQQLMELPSAGNGGNDQIVGDPDRMPTVTKIVEPVIPQKLKEDGIKAEIWVSFLIGKDGTVEEAHVSKIQKFNPQTGKFERVDGIGYGLVEATLKAATKWQFRPAEQNGKEVRAYSEQIFSFGF